jgi:thioredoxin 1
MKNFILPLFVLLLFTACEKEGSGGHEPVAGLTAITSLSQIQGELSSGVSLIFYHASWCSICNAQRPAVIAVAQDSDLSTAYFGEVEYDDYPDIISAYNIQGFPTIVIYLDGVEVERLNGGGHSTATIKQAVLDHL